MSSKPHPSSSILPVTSYYLFWRHETACSLKLSFYSVLLCTLLLTQILSCIWDLDTIVSLGLFKPTTLFLTANFSSQISMFFCVFAASRQKTKSLCKIKKRRNYQSSLQRPNLFKYWNITCRLASICHSSYLSKSTIHIVWSFSTDRYKREATQSFCNTSIGYNHEIYCT